jgi:Fe2+ transport system protein FeoA
MKLTELNKGDRAKIIKVSNQRLRDMGIREGRILEALQVGKTLSLVKIDFCVFGVSEEIIVEKV